MLGAGRRAGKGQGRARLCQQWPSFRWPWMSLSSLEHGLLFSRDSQLQSVQVEVTVALLCFRNSSYASRLDERLIIGPCRSRVVSNSSFRSPIERNEITERPVNSSFTNWDLIGGQRARCLFSSPVGRGVGVGEGCCNLKLKMKLQLATPYYFQ